MNKDKVKNWTILIYAAGNNELAPEMLEAKKAAEKVGSGDNVNVVMQLGRESRELVKIVRPLETIPEESEAWIGVRRYYVRNPKSELIKNLGNINMADPHVLYDFITWGIKAYPAEKYMVVLSGHGGSFVAVLSDLSQNNPYMMGIIEMGKVLNMAAKETGAAIDILVLDTCYMNTIEVIYEFGKEKNPPIKNILTYIGGGPIMGLPYDRLIASLEQNRSEEELSIIIKNVIETMELSLVGIEINYRKLREIKKLVNELAYSYLTNKPFIKKSPNELIYNLEKDSSWYKYALKFQNKLNEIAVYANFQEDSVISIVTKDMYSSDVVKELTPLYYKLSFGKNNYWSYVLSNTPVEENLDFKTETNLLPLIITPRGVRNIIWAINPSLKEEEAEELTKKPYKYKGWEDNKGICKKVKRQKT